MSNQSDLFKMPILKLDYKVSLFEYLSVIKKSRL